MNIEALLYEEESAILDFKEEQYLFIDEDNKHKKSELLKDILAFANAWRQSDAYILIGIREVKGGKSEVLGIEEDIDDASLQEFINKKLNRPIEFEYKSIKLEGKNIAYIKIPIQNRPFYTKKDYGIIKKNMVYLRRGSSTDIADPDEIFKMGEDNVNIGSKNPADYKIIAKLIPISFKSDIEDELKRHSKRIFQIIFIIENIGTTSDTNIGITIDSLNKIIEDYELENYLEDCINFIKPPEDDTSYSYMDKNEYNLYAPPPPKIFNPNPYRKHLEIQLNSISVELREMYVGDKKEVLKEKIIFIEAEDEKVSTLDFNIKSKETKAVISKSIELVLLEEQRDINEVLEFFNM